jgi:hypothetical protein
LKTAISIRRVLPPCLALLLLPSLAAAADIIDRIAVSVGNRVVTTSDLDREIRVSAFLGGTQPDFSPASKRATAERLIDQTLIRRELGTSRYPDSAVGEIQTALADFKKKQFAGDDEYRRALQAYGITEEEVKDELRWQRTLLMFLGVRFRAGVEVSEQDILDYFTRVVEPAARNAHPGQAPELSEYHDQIEEKLTGDRVDQEVEVWLQEARKRTDVVYHEEALR